MRQFMGCERAIPGSLSDLVQCPVLAAVSLTVQSIPHLSSPQPPRPYPSSFVKKNKKIKKK
jgi:hypothetical protein